MLTQAGFSSEPYLSGALAYETVSAVQAAGVIASTKVRLVVGKTSRRLLTLLSQHYIANEQETNRNPSSGVESVSSNIDDRTMHEVYLW